MPRISAPSGQDASPLSLSRAAARLLAAMAAPDVVAMPDPSRDDHVLLRRGRGAVSLGGGSHPRARLDELIRRGLVEACPRGGIYQVAAAGRAWLARDGSRREGHGDEAFGRQHREMSEVRLAGESGPEDLAVNSRESPLVWLRRRRGQDGEPLIDAAAYEAGERLRRDLTFAGLLPSVTARWDGVIGGGAQASRDPAGATDTVIAARQRVRAALAAVGADFADLLVDLCGFLKGVETIERERRWPQRSGKIVIRLALAQLARHYGLASEARGRDGSTGVRAWIADMEAA